MQSSSLHISVSRQQLSVLGAAGEILRSFPVSTSRHGLGCEEGSLKTPLGRFEIARKIGDGAAPGAVFKGRVATGGIGTAEDAEDLVQTRILWLHGLEPENANTMQRYVYIHGTNHEAEIGTPASHGCVRMRNADVVELFDLVADGTPVEIRP